VTGPSSAGDPRPREAGVLSFYHYVWWNIGLRFCDLGGRVFGYQRWNRLGGCRVHGGILSRGYTLPNWAWELFGWYTPKSQP
jgi:hypothetical protein